MKPDTGYFKNGDSVHLTHGTGMPLLLNHIRTLLSKMAATVKCQVSPPSQWCPKEPRFTCTLCSHGETFVAVVGSCCEGVQCGYGLCGTSFRKKKHWKRHNTQIHPGGEVERWLRSRNTPTSCRQSEFILNSLFEIIGSITKITHVHKIYEFWKKVTVSRGDYFRYRTWKIRE